MSTKATVSAPRTKALLHRIVASEQGFAPIPLRVALAVTMFPHGAQKVLGWFGGHGMSGTIEFFSSLGIPVPMSVGIILLEFLGPILLLLGVGTRLVALGFLGIMVGAIVSVHGQHGFFMNWFGQQAGEGIEYHILVIGIAAALVLSGSGRFAVDTRIARRLGRRLR